MAKSKVFITFSERASMLASSLRDELEGASYDAMLWDENARRQPGISIEETLNNTAQQFDLALIVLAKEDILPTSTHGGNNARDNCIFEAGFLNARMGHNRCLLVHGAKLEDLPASLRETTQIEFEEPSDPSDPCGCARAMAPVAAGLEANLTREKGAAFRAHVPLLSVQDLFARERPYSQGGDLREGIVIVCDTQPQAGVDFALQVNDNISNGVSYHYFFYFSNETIDKIIQALQVMSVASVARSEDVEDFKTRIRIIKDAPDPIQRAMSDFSTSRSMLVTLLADEPQFCFRFHNASDPKLAQLYARYLDRGYLLWATGPTASNLWRSVPKYLDESKSNRIFVPMKHYDLDKEHAALFERSLSQALRRYFPGIEASIRDICIGKGNG